MINLLKKENNSLLYLVLGAAIIFVFAYSWVPGGLDVDSCNYAVVAKEIVRTNQWLNLYDPVYGGVFYYHFPLCIWASAALFKLLGVSTFAAKLFSMLCGVTLVGVLFYFGRLLKNQWVGFFAALSFLLTNHIIRLSRQCRMDIPVSLFITLAILCFIMAQRRTRLYYLLFGLFTFLAIFSKEVQGVAPLVIAFLYLAIRLKWKEFFHPLFILGLFIAIAPVLLWAWLDKSVLFTPWLHQNFMHLYKSPALTVRWYYYIWAIITKYAYFLPFAIYGGYLTFKDGKQNHNYEFLLLFIWIVIFPLAFSFGSQKLHYFILPIYPAASLLTGIALERLLKDSVKIRVAAGLKYILFTIAIVMLCFPLNVQSKRFIETVRLAPAIDAVLKQAPDYKFIVHNQDKSAILFYSRQISRVEDVTDKAALEGILAQTDSARAVFCYMSWDDFFKLSEGIKEKCRVLVKYRNNILLVNQKNSDFIVNLP